MNYKRIAAAALCVCLAAPVTLSCPPVQQSFAVVVDDNVKMEIEDIYMYKNYGDHVEICAVSTMTEGDIIVPEKIAGVAVTAVGEHGFAGASKITSVTLPDTVTVIGKQAFSNCTALKNVNIPEGVTAIGDEAFLNCLSLEGITLPKKLTSIGIRSFYNCQKLKEVKIPDSVSSIGDGAFSSCTGLESFKIPPLITSLENNVLNNCKSITHLVLSKNVEKIGMMSLPSDLECLTIENPDFEADSLRLNVNKKCLLIVPYDSSVIEFAVENGINYDLIDPHCVVVPGDVNFDWEITIADLVMMSNYLLNNGELKEYDLGDMNNDGTVDVFDFILLRKEVISSTTVPPLTNSSVLISKDYVPEVVEAQEIDKEFSVGQTEFAISLLKNEYSNDKNSLISPYSIIQALGMTANGAAGDTKTEMERVLGNMPIEKLNSYLKTVRESQTITDTCKLSTANSIWVKNGGGLSVYPEFLQTNANYFNSDVYYAPFDNTTVTDINNWVNTNTDGMIKKLLNENEISKDAAVYLINAVTFDAEWANKYTDHSIGNYDFYAGDGSVQNCEMMNSKENFYISDENADGFLKYYDGNKYAFAAILPDENISLEDYISGLTAESFYEMISNPHIEYDHIRARLPKFSFDDDLQLKDTLSDMGMPTAFIKEEADFSNMGQSDLDIIYINKVKHMTHIEVNEAGTKAGAVISVEVNAPTSVAPQPEINVILDRPFLFSIIDTENNIPVFIGTLNNIE